MWRKSKEIAKDGEKDDFPYIGSIGSLSLSLSLSFFLLHLLSSEVPKLTTCTTLFFDQNHWLILLVPIAFAQKENHFYLKSNMSLT